jgi:hypothetical protein
MEDAAAKGLTVTESVERIKRIHWSLRRLHFILVARIPSKALRELIFRMVVENSTWGAPRIHGELKMLGYEISERTVLRWMGKAPRNPAPARRWAFCLFHRYPFVPMARLNV